MERFSENMEEFLEKAGQIFGEHVVAPFLEKKRKEIDKFEIEVTGQENLERVKGKPFLLVSNHLMPEGGTAQQSQLSPDAFVLERLVHDAISEELNIVSKSDDGWEANNIYKYFQRYISQPFGKGMSEGSGFTPISKNRSKEELGNFNRDFLKAIENVVKGENGPILIFPEGHWYKDWDPEHKLETGAAHIARKHQLPIVPVYIGGATSWHPGTKVKVNFGAPIEAEGLDKHQVTEQIGMSFTELQKAITNK